MITIRDLEFEYRRGEFHLHIPELVIPDGAKTALIGPSGSGKTTFLNLVSGIASPRFGSVRVEDQEVSLLSDSACRAFRITNIGFVFQDFELLEYLSVLDNILQPYRINRALRLTPEVRDRAQSLAEGTGLAKLLSRRPDQLSHGEKQRAAICRALLAGPRVILADEPTGNLDPANKDRVLDLLIHHARQAGATLLVVTHDLGLLDRFDEVIDFGRFHREAEA
jgi:ABC-type lipoprotein export system ATPase subunit